MTTVVVDPKPKRSKSVLAVKGNQDSIADEFHIINGSLLREPIDEIELF